ncbi:MAG: 2,6-dihydropseudooxynicotine hydrolase [Chlamydiae bacterium]|nr:2,6-dihydropseudooxynicotine hydrolase [Chlamydiota bacterium]
MKIRFICIFLFLMVSMVPMNGDTKPFFKSNLYSFQALRAMAAASSGGADIGECLAAISKIEDGDDESWYCAWYDLAKRLEAEALEMGSKGHDVSAASLSLRASNYYRTSEFFLHINPDDPRILETCGRSKACFLKGIKDQPITEVEIPFEGTTLPGYLCLAGETKGPLLIVQTGFDGTAEELYFVVAQAALKHGFHCLIFEGPGQGRVIRQQKIPFRPNWETVITPVIDFAVSLDQVNPEKIALMGMSFGGYLVPRALVFEPRIKVGIANGGVLDFHEVVMADSPPDFEAILDQEEAKELVNKEVLKAMETDAGARWAIGHGMYTFQAKSPVDWFVMSREYHLRDCIDQIKCPMLIVDSENDWQMKGQAQKFYDGLRCPKEFLLFRAEEGAGVHCQIGAYALSGERIFSWLEDQLCFK